MRLPAVSYAENGEAVFMGEYLKRNGRLLLAAVVIVLFCAALPELFDRPAAGAFLVFLLLYPPCVAAIGAVKSELGARYAVAVFAFQVAVAWIVAFVVHSAGILLGLA